MAVTSEKSDMSEFKCVFCERANCDHGGMYKELAVDAFLDKAGFDRVSFNCNNS